ncbi:hypothetical protein BC628DRAFT_782206 [Trametes gibbosa]|nr:hypothetical protein BC628DRAFT_782206 [Trametes gibbosa]
MCMVFCVTYALACAIIQITSLPLLFMGRFLGGVSTAILFSCFESWLVSSANAISLPSHDLSTIFGHASLVNSVAATLAGVASNKLVEYSSLLNSPFIASGILLVLTLAIISATWEENFGGVEVVAGNLVYMRRLAKAWDAVRADRRLLVLGFIQTCFEGSMYLFVFLWVPFLQEASSPDYALPLGYIFSSLMLSMTFGALLYNVTISRDRHQTEEPASDDLERIVKLHAQLSAAVCAAAAMALMTSIASRREHLRFWAFCAFEVCVGVYYPVQGMLRGKLVPDEHRATVSSLFRVPLNVFVVVSLMTGVASARHLVLFACSLLLLFTSLVTAVVFLIRLQRPALASLRVE